MANKRTALAGGAGWIALNSIWAAYSLFTTARDLSEDAGRARVMLADPPVELPWILAAVGIVFVLWVWLKWTDDQPQEEGPDEKTAKAETKGKNSPVTQNLNEGGVVQNLGEGTQNVFLGPVELNQDKQEGGRAFSVSGSARMIVRGVNVENCDVAFEATEGGSLEVYDANVVDCRQELEDEKRDKPALQPPSKSDD